MSDFSDKVNFFVSKKSDVRRLLLTKRRELTPAQRAAAAAAISTAVRELVTLERPTIVAAYVPIGSEPGGADLPTAIHQSLQALPGQRQLLLPVLRADLDLEWAPWAGEPLAPADRGLLEPTSPRLGRSAISAAELILVPAVAVDQAGHRLGRGGGSYDRALARAGAHATIVALLHDGELVDDIPVEPHDRRVNAVITPTRGLVSLDADGPDDAVLALG